MPVALDRLRAGLGDRYVIERELGRGGMATVYLAHDVRHDRQVALKVLLPELAAAVGQERFLLEIRTAAALSHPHILPLHDSGEAADTLFYVMPYVEGESLRDRLTREKQLPIDDAVGIAVQVANALAYAHSRGVVHRDIKPENIMLSGGTAVVADFGIARAVTAAGDQRLTDTGMIIGTPAYMSPEQATGSPDVDGRSDQYSLGCVLYEMVVGHPPFLGTSVQEVIARHTLDAVSPPSVVRPAIPAAVEDAILRALAKLPADRFPTTTLFVAALTEPSQTRPVGGRRRGWTATAGAGAVVVIGALLAAGQFGLFRASRVGGGVITSLAVMPFRNLTGDTAQVFLAVSATEQVVNSLVRLSALRVIKVDGSRSAEATSRLLKDNGFDAVLNGSIVRAGNAVRITVQLSSVETGQAMPGGGNYNGVMTDILALQDEVARSVADSIRIAMTPQERSLLVTERPAVSAAAYEAYARGLAFLGSPAPHIRQAIASFRRAIAEDSSYAAAWLGLAFGYTELGYFGMVLPAEAYPAGRAAALRALTLDSLLGEAYAALAVVDFNFDWDFAAADRHFRQAIALSPRNAHLHFYYAMYLAAAGRRAESMAEVKRTQALDPASLAVSAAMARPYYSARRYDLAIAQALKTLELDSSFSRALFWLGLSYEQTSRLPEAIRALERTVAVAPIPVYQASLGHAYAVAGERAKAQEILRALLERGRTSYVSAFDIAILHAGLGDRQRTLQALERAVDQRAAYLAFLNVDARFDAFRDDPRFRDLIRRMGLPTSN